MAGNLLKYAGPLQWSDLPIDSHELIALSAPRPLFIGGGATNGDGWADSKGMFMAAAAASTVYRLLGKRGLDTTVFPPIETPLIAGDLAFVSTPVVTHRLPIGRRSSLSTAVI
jgi:hypothetical protein